VSLVAALVLAAEEPIGPVLVAPTLVVGAALALTSERPLTVPVPSLSPTPLAHPQFPRTPSTLTRPIKR